MTKAFKIFLIALTVLSSCKNKQKPDQEHEHGPDPVSYTVYSDKTELFVEFNPLVTGQSTRFAAHLTKLGKVFTPVVSGSLTVSLIKSGKGIRHSVDTPSSPGIFKPVLTPKEPGIYELVFDIVTNEYKDQIRIDSVIVYADEMSALKDQQPEATESTVIFLKEAAWKIEFANIEVKKDTIHEVIKTSGQILAGQGDEQLIIAKASGTIQFEKKNLLTGTKVNAGDLLFSLSGKGLGEGNIDAQSQNALATYNKARADYERATELVKDKIISEKEYESRKMEFEKARANYQSFSGGNKVTAPVSGFLRSLNVINGQFVSQGEVIGSVTQNKNLVIKAELSQKYSNRLSSLKSANIKTSNGKAYSSEELNIHVLTFGKVSNAQSLYSTILFSTDPDPDLVPGSFVELFIKGEPVSNALTIPVSALIEEQGIMYVFVQTAGESFQKREVSTGINDGVRVQILTGVNEGERVVTKGAYQLKLAAMSGALPSHGHEH